MSERDDFEPLSLKVCFLGAASVGKTSILYRFCNGQFVTDVKSTIGAGFFTHVVKHHGQEVILLLWDTAGEERFRSVAPSLLRGANGLFLVYDLTRADTMESLDVYLQMFIDNVDVDVANDLPVVILGNKCDLDEREVQQSDIQAWCEKNRIKHHFVCSAKTGQNVGEAMTALVDMMMKPIDNIDKSTLRINVPSTNRSACC